MIIQEYIKKKTEQIRSGKILNDQNLEKETISAILGKNKEEVTREEIDILIDIYFNSCMSKKGINYSDERYRMNIQNINYYLKQGLSYDEALAKKDELPLKTPNKYEPKIEYIQELLKDLYIRPLKQESFYYNRENIERETISKILNKKPEEVTAEEIYLLNYMTDRATIYFTGDRCNNLNDDDYIKFLQNMQAHMKNGLSLEDAAIECFHPPEDLSKNDQVIDPVDKKIEFMNKYPTLFEDGELKDSAYILLDSLLEQYNQLIPDIISPEKHKI